MGNLGWDDKNVPIDRQKVKDEAAKLKEQDRLRKAITTTNYKGKHKKK
jgi:aspartyl/asparaginyl beta-hydroxylase (cupin superfamily)